jgi:exodeoxyribonuclease V alpha subunit
LYTGATRPTDRLVIMGEQTMVNAAIKKGNTALNRKVCLGGLIAQAV